jgi:2-aminoadipate transaminase
MAASVASKAAANVRGSAIRDLLALTERPEVLSMAGGLPAPELLPAQRISASGQHALADPGALQYTASAGAARCRAAVAERLGVDPSTVLVTHGSQQALSLLAQALVDPGDVVVVDDPVYVGALQVFQAVRADIRAVPIGPEGTDVDALARLLEGGVRPAIVHTVSNFHNPRGVTATAATRDRLAALADRYGFWIVEDDPYGELRFRGEPIDPIAARSDRVIRLGSASKILAPALRVGWMSAPVEILAVVERLRQAADLCGSTLSQLIVAELLSDTPWLTDHLSAQRAEYQTRCDALVTALRTELGDRAIFAEPDGGMFCWVRIPGIDAERLLPTAVEHGVGYVPGAAFAVAADLRDCLRLSFATLTADRLGEAVVRLGRAVDTAAG